jgi:hypothetical protein
MTVAPRMVASNRMRIEMDPIASSPHARHRLRWSGPWTEM